MCVGISVCRDATPYSVGLWECGGISVCGDATPYSESGLVNDLCMLVVYLVPSPVRSEATLGSRNAKMVHSIGLLSRLRLSFSHAIFLLGFVVVHLACMVVNMCGAFDRRFVVVPLAYKDAMFVYQDM